MEDARALVLWVLVLCAAPAAGAVSEQACARCHPAEVKRHGETRMAHAMVAASESAFAKNLPQGGQALREPGRGFAFTFEPGITGLIMQAQRGDETAQGTMEWVMGAGAQGQTPLVVAADGQTLESRISYFPQLGRYGVTIGQDGGASANAAAALGKPQSGRALAECMGCHSTQVNSEMTPGVQCVRCHSNAAAHAASRGSVGSPGKMSAREQVAFCGGCHRLTAPVDEHQLENVRFQPLRLEKSKCFGSGKLACTTCHVAHEDARRNDPAYYNAKCLACHAGGSFHADERAAGNCVGCHMPRVELHPALHFTDHWIR